MITGVIKAREARIHLTVRGPDAEERIEAVVDTGFNGSLSLPLSLVTFLKLPWDNVVRGTLADGSTTLLPVYRASIVWDR
jgi:clan AA aspartic protease